MHTNLTNNFADESVMICCPNLIDLLFLFEKFPLFFVFNTYLLIHIRSIIEIFDMCAAFTLYAWLTFLNFCFFEMDYTSSWCKVSSVICSGRFLLHKHNAKKNEQFCLWLLLLISSWHVGVVCSLLLFAATCWFERELSCHVRDCHLQHAVCWSIFIEF